MRYFLFIDHQYCFELLAIAHVRHIQRIKTPVPQRKPYYSSGLFSKRFPFVWLAIEALHQYKRESVEQRERLSFQGHV